VGVIPAFKSFETLNGDIVKNVLAGALSSLSSGIPSSIFLEFACVQD
jgi:hypothetical protein